VDDGSEPIADEELLYRRVPLCWHSTDSGLNHQAFAPHKNDSTGLSIARAKYKSIEQAARGQPGKAYFVATLVAGQLRANGIEIAPRPLPGDPGHAELPQLNAGNRKDDQTLELQRLLVTLCGVDGPFQS
jgi:hypothetical protein